MRHSGEAVGAVADVVLCFSSDGTKAAGLIAARLAARGYRIWSEDQADAGPIADRIAAVRAAVVLWSGGSRASEWVKAEANFARGQGKLVQAALDEAAPPLPFDSRAAIPLAGWTGDEAHPAWRRLLAELERIAPVAASVPAPAAAPEAKRPAAVAPPAPRPVRRGRSGLVAAGLLFLLLVAAGAFLWMRSGPPYGSDAGPDANSVVAVTKTGPPPPASGPAPADLTPESTPFAEPMAEPSPAVPPPGGTSAQPSPPPRPSGPRINRRNSENMRLFCERAGRGTPECRRFQQQLRRQGR